MSITATRWELENECVCQRRSADSWFLRSPGFRGPFAWLEYSLLLAALLVQQFRLFDLSSRSALACHAPVTIKFVLAFSLECRIIIRLVSESLLNALCVMFESLFTSQLAVHRH